MIEKDIKEKRLNQKGQTLLFVVVAVTIALAVGVSVSTRTLSSLRRVSRSDTSSRVIAAAEGGVENLLNKNYALLDAAITPDEGGCSGIGAIFDQSLGKCVYNFTQTSDESGDQISSRAIVQVETYSTTTADGTGYAFDLDPDLVKEVSLDGFSGSIKLCWENPLSAIYYFSYNQNGDVDKGGAYSSGVTQSLDDGFDSEIGETIGGIVYAGCTTIDSLVSTPYGLRLRILYASSRIGVYPIGDSLPTQGYKLTSIGELITQGGEKETATVIVHKSFPYASSVFDYGIYTPTPLQ